MTYSRPTGKLVGWSSTVLSRLAKRDLHVPAEAVDAMRGFDCPPLCNDQDGFIEDPFSIHFFEHFSQAGFVPFWETQLNVFFVGCGLKLNGAVIAHGAELRDDAGGLTHESVESFLRMIHPLDERGRAAWSEDAEKSDANSNIPYFGLDLCLELCERRRESSAPFMKYYDVISHPLLMADADAIIEYGLAGEDTEWTNLVISAASPPMCIQLLNPSHHWSIVEAAALRAERMRLKDALPALVRLASIEIPNGRINQHIRAVRRALETIGTP